MELAHVVERLTRNSKQLPCGADSRSVAVGARMLHHHLVEPRFHTGASLAPLPVPAVMPFDAPRDSAEANLLAFVVFTLNLRVRRHAHDDFLAVQSFEDRAPHRLRQLLPRRFAGETQCLRTPG